MRSSSLKPQAFTLKLTGEDEEKFYRRWKGYSFLPLSKVQLIQAITLFLMGWSPLYRQIYAENLII